MHLLNETTVNTIMDACWTAYRAAKRGIDILESIGLSVEGAAKDKARDMSILFEAQTAAENAMFAIAGLQRAANAADKASAILAKEAGANDPPSSSGGILFELRRLAENVSTDTDPSLQPFEVTLSITGGLTVYGSSEDDAIRRANAMPSDDLIRNGCWDSPGATDAYEG